MVTFSIGREPFAKFSGLREIKIVKIARKGAFAKYTSCNNLYVYGIIIVIVYMLYNSCMVGRLVHGAQKP